MTNTTGHGVEARRTWQAKAVRLAGKGIRTRGFWLSLLPPILIPFWLALGWQVGATLGSWLEGCAR